MDKSTMLIITIVGMVAIVGVLTIVPLPDLSLSGDSLAGNVVYTQGASCARCTGEPVCAAKDGKLNDYKNSCEALCDNARVVYAEGYCAAIPHAKTA